MQNSTTRHVTVLFMAQLLITLSGCTTTLSEHGAKLNHPDALQFEIIKINNAYLDDSGDSARVCMSTHNLKTGILSDMMLTIPLNKRTRVTAINTSERAKSQGREDPMFKILGSHLRFIPTRNDLVDQCMESGQRLMIIDATPDPAQHISPVDLRTLPPRLPDNTSSAIYIMSLDNHLLNFGYVSSALIANKSYLINVVEADFYESPPIPVNNFVSDPEFVLFLIKMAALIGLVSFIL